MGQVVELPGRRRKPPIAVNGKVPPRRRPNRVTRTREYLTPDEVNRLMKGANDSRRHGNRDQTLLMIMFRHGLRVTEAVSLRWDQIELKAGLLHVNRLKNGVPSTHPLRGPEIPPAAATQAGLARLALLVRFRAGRTHDLKQCPQAGDQGRQDRIPALPSPSTHAPSRLRLQARQSRSRYPRFAVLPGVQQHHAHGAIYRNGGRIDLRGFWERLAPQPNCSPVSFKPRAAIELAVSIRPPNCSSECHLICHETLMYSGRHSCNRLLRTRC